VLQPPARRLSNAVRKSFYRYEADGVATIHYLPFLDDHRFLERYSAVAGLWDGRDIRWRLWVLTKSAEHCAALDGSFAEFGVWRGGCAYMILSGSRPLSGRSYFLFDTFQGIPDSNLTAQETAAGFAGRLSNVSLSDVRTRLDPWRDQLNFVVGDIFKTLPETETGPLAFVHLDLNAAAATELALRYAWPRLLTSGMVVFDDYGQDDYSEQRRLVDEFFATEKAPVIALPSSQALAIKV
jgi:hypothetical protein